MIKLIRRAGGRFGAVALVAAAGLAVTALPASAAPGVDLEVTVKSGVVASGSAAKPFLVKVTNVGDAKSDGFRFVIETTFVDAYKVNVGLPDELDEFCEEYTKKFICEFGNVLVRNDSLEIPIEVAPISGRPIGDAGSFAVTATSDQDVNMRNNSVGVPVAVSPHGVDIVVWADDVVAGRDNETDEAKRIPPGGTGELAFAAFNVGSLVAKGIDLTVQLPEHVTFTADVENCKRSGDNRRLTCSLPDVELEPNGAVGTEEPIPVKVADNAPQSVELKGTIEGHALGVLEAVSAASRKSTAPSGWTRSGEKFDPSEVDNKDNTDEFVVFVGAGTGGGGGGGGGLPVTGPKAIAIGGVGAVVLGAGVFPFVAGRRRRVVLVTPSE